MELNNGIPVVVFSGTGPAHFPSSRMEYEILDSILTYERVRGRPATRTRQMLARRGIRETARRLVTRKGVSRAFETLRAEGLKWRTIEAVVMAYPEMFSPEAVYSSALRLKGVAK